MGLQLASVKPLHSNVVSVKSHYTRARTNLVNAGNCTLLTDSLRKEDRRMHIEETENIERQIEEILFVVGLCAPISDHFTAV